MNSGPGLLKSPGRLAGGAEDHAAKGLVARVWGRLPAIVRAFLVATLVTFAGNTPWAVLVLANLQLRPDVPWAVLVMAAYLGLYWQYLGGRWWPRSTAAARRRDLRAHPLSPRVWRWSLLAGGLAMATLFAMKPVVGRLVTLRYAVPDLLLQLPLLTLVSTLLMTSVVAGMVEEAAYRGYMPVVLGVATVWAFRRLAMVTRGEREAGTAVLQ